MMQFVFKYQTLLTHRRNLEDQRQRDLAQQMRTRMILQNELRNMQGTIRDSKRQLGAGLGGRVDVAAISQFAGFSGHTTQRAQQIVLRLAELEKKVEHARSQLLEATRHRQALELLQEKHREAWLREQRRREALEMDEIAAQQYTRRLMAEAI